MTAAVVELPFVTVLKLSVAGYVNAFSWLIARLWSWWWRNRTLRLKWKPTAREKVRYRNYVNTYVCVRMILWLMIIFILNISPELKHSLYSSPLMCPQFCPLQLSQAFSAGLGALYGPLILYKPPTSVHRRIVNTFKGNKYYSKFIQSINTTYIGNQY